MAGIVGLGNNTLIQIVLYNLVGQLLGALLTPYGQAITNQVNAASPLVPLSPAELAALVVRGELTEDDAAGQARLSGTDAARFHLLARLAGDAPGPGDMAVALRRGLVDEPTYRRGIAQGRLRNEWAELVKALAVQQPTPEAMLAAYLEGQLSEADARARFAHLGGDPDYFDILFHTQGQAPTPTQAADLANRGIIPWEGEGPAAVSFRQAFLEGPWRNKWEPPMREGAKYLPPPRTVVAMYREGSLDHARAAELLSKQGLAADLVSAYLTSGSHQRTVKSRDLAQTTILELYRDRLIDKPTAHAMLVGLTYDDTEADFLTAIEDTRVAQRFLGAAVNRIHALYVGHKLDRNTALSVLAQLGLDSTGAGDSVTIWDYERAANVATLTRAEIRSAFHYKIIDQPTAQAQLVELGLTPHDAWVYLSIGAHGPLADAPAADAIGPGPTP